MGDFKPDIKPVISQFQHSCVLHSTQMKCDDSVHIKIEFISSDTKDVKGDVPSVKNDRSPSPPPKVGSPINSSDSTAQTPGALTCQKCGDHFKRSSALDRHGSMCRGKSVSYEDGNLVSSSSEEEEWEESTEASTHQTEPVKGSGEDSGHQSSHLSRANNDCLSEESEAVEDKERKRGAEAVNPTPGSSEEWDKLWKGSRGRCPFSSRVFKTKKGWKGHIRREKEAAKVPKISLPIMSLQKWHQLWCDSKPSCRFCSKTYVSEKGWKQHILKQHALALPCEDTSGENATGGQATGRKTTENPEDIAAAFQEGARLFMEEGRYSPIAKQYWQGLRKSFKQTCPLCKTTLEAKREWVDHVLQHHTNHQLKCPHCPAVYKRFSSLKSHKKMFHSGSNEAHLALPCPSCGQIFEGYASRKLAERALSNHVKLHRVKEKPVSYLCSKCGKGFTCQTKLKKHSAVHLTVRAFICETCLKSFKRRGALTQHVKKVHLKIKYPEVMCEICGKSYRKNLYPAHLQTHNKDKSFRCPECGAAFRTLISLHQHKIFHTGKRKHTCEICSSSFFLKHHLQAHMKSHSDVKPFHCHICEMDFRLKHHLQAHRVRRHGAKSEARVRGPKAKVVDGLRSRPPLVTHAASSA